MGQNSKKVNSASSRVEKLSECFLHFGPDARLNINMLTQLCGEILGASCALYNRLQDDYLVAWGQWQTPPDFNPVDRAEGHICYDVITRSGNDILLVRDLQNTPYADSDPNVRRFNLQTYIGIATSLKGEKVGSLCAVFQSSHVPSQADLTLLRLIGKAIGMEEERLDAKDQSRDGHSRLFSILDNLDTVIFVTCLQSQEVLYMNKHAIALFGKGIGRKCWEVFQKDQDGPCSFCPNPPFLSERDKHCHSFSWEMKNTRNGRWYDMRDSAITWIDGRLARLQIATDISESKVDCLGER